eukprot:2073094-Alexandrium_andersonii.AAC.1
MLCPSRGSPRLFSSRAFRSHRLHCGFDTSKDQGFLAQISAEAELAALHRGALAGIWIQNARYELYKEWLLMA